MSIRRVTVAEPRVFYPAEVDGVVMAPSQLKQRTYQRYVESLRGRLTDIHQLVSERVQQEQSRRTDAQSTGAFKLGDTVWCRNFRAERGVKGKLQPKFEGPYSIIKCRPPDYLLRKGRRRRWIHGAHLKRADTWDSREVAVESESETEPETSTVGGRPQAVGADSRQFELVATAGGLPWAEATTVAGERPWPATDGRQQAEAVTDERQLDETAADERRPAEAAAGGRLLAGTAADERQLAEVTAGRRQLEETAAGEQLLEESATGEQPMDEASTGERPMELIAADGRPMVVTADGRPVGTTVANERTLETTGAETAIAMCGDGRLT
ncbi:hypothetical protein FJT64_006201 [Amphibalanus amphitrite]|uniref:Retrovirus-related Pol polyprotein from transposon 412 n=1 Tax=Amphibalanus amphitrite TaxID=1232801 RepID=A0A6A4VY10_AMPAM|nr:hypothetical protein FJT64_006201 [Amphibalanus amphitrite]